MRASLATLALAALLGCPSAPEPAPLDDGVEYVFPPGDATEQEPNDAAGLAQDLGVLAAPYAVTGRSSACGDGGTWGDADPDWLSFQPATGDPLRIVLDMHGGDLDVALFDSDEELVQDGAAPGLDDEALAVSLDPDRAWLLRIRCWQGRPDALWRLRIEPP